MKRTIAMILAVVMILALSLSTVAFADDDVTTATGTITITNNHPAVSMYGNTYYAYKLFDVTYNADKSAYSYTIDKKIGEGEDEHDNPFFSIMTSNDAKDYFTVVASTTTGTYNVTPVENFDARAFADYITKSKVLDDDDIDADFEETAKDANVVTIYNVPDGYYIVAGTATATDTDDVDVAADKKTVTAALALTTVDGSEKSGEINLKADAPTIDKFIAEADSADGKEGKGTAQDVGDVVEFVSYSKVPDMTGYDSYKFIIHDEMSEGLDFNFTNGVTIKIGDYTLEKDDYTLKTSFEDEETEEGAPEHTCDFDVIITDLKAFTTCKPPKFNVGDKITLTYSATINEKALNTFVETNKIKLEYSNKPGSEGTGETIEHKVYVYDFDIGIDKFAGPCLDGASTTTTKLAGAQFVLYKKVVEGEGENKKEVNKYYKLTENGVSWVYVDAEDSPTVVETDSNGYAHFEGLDSGTYYLHETKAPAGYNLLTKDEEVTISPVYEDDGTLNVGASEVKEIDYVDEKTKETIQKYEVTKGVENLKGKRLPETGGVGTTLLVTFGALLFMTTAVVLVTKKRMYNEGC